MMDVKKAKFPRSGAFRPIGQPSSPHSPVAHDTVARDRTMAAVGKNIAVERGMGGDQTYTNYIYRRMEQKQRIAINKFGSTKQSQKKLHQFYGNMGGVFDAKQMKYMYGIYQDGSKGGMMLENRRPMDMRPGDVVYNNLVGEIGMLKEFQDRGNDGILVFQDRSFRVDKSAHGWSVATQDDAIQSQTSPIAASSAVNPAMFKEEFDKKKKDIPLNQSKPASQVEKGANVELEHTDNKEKAKDIAKDHLRENPDYYKHLNPSAPGKEFLIKMDDEDEEEDDDDGWEDDVEFADNAKKPYPVASPQTSTAMNYSTPSSPAYSKPAAIQPSTKMDTRGAMHNFPGGPASFHNEMGKAMKDVAPGSRVHVSGPGGNFFGTYKGAGMPLKPVGGSKPLKHYENSFAGSGTQTFKHGDYTIKHVMPGQTPKERANVPMQKAESHFDLMSHWKDQHSTYKNQLSEEMAKGPKANIQTVSHLTEKTSAFESFFKQHEAEGHREKMTSTSMPVEHSLREHVGSMNQTNKESLSFPIREHRPPKMSSSQTSKWAEGPITGNQSQREFIKKGTKAQGITPQGGHEIKEGAIDIHKHGEYLAKTSKQMSLYVENEKGEVVHKEEGTIHDYPYLHQKASKHGKVSGVIADINTGMSKQMMNKSDNSDYSKILSAHKESQRISDRLTGTDRLSLPFKKNATELRSKGKLSGERKMTPGRGAGAGSELNSNVRNKVVGGSSDFGRDISGVNAMINTNRGGASAGQRIKELRNETSPSAERKVTPQKGKSFVPKKERIYGAEPKPKAEPKLTSSQIISDVENRENAKKTSLVDVKELSRNR